MRFIQLLLVLRKIKFLPFQYLIYYIFKILSIEIPIKVKIGSNFLLPHWGVGVVIHSNCILKNNIKVYQGVTIGYASVYNKTPENFKIVIEDNVLFCAGAKILAKNSCIIEEGVIVAANSVLIIKEEKVIKGTYVGIPAQRIN